MSIQWVLVASFLYLELGFIALLLLPFISCRIWKGVLNFYLWRKLREKATIYFSIFLAVLVLFFLDSIRDMMKYSGKHPEKTLEAEMQMQVKLFRAQRNYYIVGFSIFLTFVIRRLAMLLEQKADLLNRNEEAMKEAQEATESAEKLVKEMHELPPPKEKSSDKYSKQIALLQNDLKAKHLEIESTKELLGSLKNTIEGVSKEYNELMEKHAQALSKAEMKSEVL